MSKDRNIEAVLEHPGFVINATSMGSWINESFKLLMIQSKLWSDNAKARSFIVFLMESDDGKRTFSDLQLADESMAIMIVASELK